LKSIKNSLDKESKTLIKNSKWVFIANIIGAGLGFLRSVFIARGLGVEIFGTYMIIMGFVFFLKEFINLNLGSAIIKFGAEFKAQNRDDKFAVLIKRSIKVSAIMAVVLVVVTAGLILISYNTFIERPHLHSFVIGFAVAAGVTYFNNITQACLRLFYKFKMNSIIQIIMDCIETVILVSAVIISPKNLTLFFIAAIVTRFLNAFVCNIMGFWEMKRELWPHKNASDSLIDEEYPVIRKFVIQNSLSNTLRSFIQQGDVLLLGTLAGAASVGFYSVAKKLAYSILTVTDPLVNSIFPQLSKLIAERKITELKRMISKIARLAIIPSAVLLLVVLFIKSFIIQMVYGVEYLPATNPFFILLVNAVFGSVTFWVLPLVQSLGLVGLRLRIYSIMLVVGAGIACLLIPVMLASGMAISMLVMNVVINLVFIYFSLQQMKPLVSRAV